MESNILLYFGKSQSPSYPKSLEYASKFDHYTPIGESSDVNLIETDNNEILSKFMYFENLVNTISGWKSARAKIRDKETKPSILMFSIRSTAECALDYVKSNNRDDYCHDFHFDCWGCKRLTGIVRDLENKPYQNYSDYWYRYGRFIDEKTWKINKSDLAKAILDIVRKKHIDFCPIFQINFFQDIINSLPDEIDISDGNKWGVIHDEIFSLGSIQKKAFNIYHISEFDLVSENAKYDFDNMSYLDRNEMSRRVTARNIPEISYEDIGGIDDILESIREVIELPIKRPELYKHMALKPYRGILLWGEPGNGKTLIAKAIAHEVSAHFIPVNGPEILSKWYGQSEENLRNIFQEAKELQPSIIFFDEIDSIALSRSNSEINRISNQLVNQLLTLMDGIEEFGKVIVMASTNRPDLLDSALLRPGRFDYKIEVKKPDAYGCRKVLEIATRGKPLHRDVVLSDIANKLIGYSAADITFVAKEATMFSLRRSIDIKSMISNDDDIDLSSISICQSDFLFAISTLNTGNKDLSKNKIKNMFENL